MLGASRDGKAKADKEKIRAMPEEHVKGSNEKTKKKAPVYPENPVKNSDSSVIFPVFVSFVTLPRCPCPSGCLQQAIYAKRRFCKTSPSISVI